MNDLGVVVCDIGSCYVKAGFAGEDAPRRVFESCVGRRRHPGIQIQHEKDYFIGDEISSFKGLLDVSSPVESGLIVNWADMENLLNHICSHELKINPEEYKFLLTETPLNPRPNRLKTLELMFENLNSQGVYLGCQATLGLYASGRTTGLVLDCGHSVTHWVPVIEGKSLPDGIARMGYAGRDLDKFLIRLLAGKGYTFSSFEEKDGVRRLKESICYVALDPVSEMNRVAEGFSDTYLLPDNTSLRLESELFRCPEALFQPAIMGLDSFGLSDAARMCLDKCAQDETLRHQLYSNVVITGGSSLFKGMRERLVKDLDKGSQPGLNVIAPPNRKYAAWVGGAIVGCMNAFQPLWIQKHEYEEHGPQVVLSKMS